MTPQAKKVLRHLQNNGSITPLEALGVYGIFRLAARVHELREDGYPVEMVINRDAKKTPFARYTLGKAQPQAASMYGTPDRVPCRPSANPLADRKAPARFPVAA